MSEKIVSGICRFASMLFKYLKKGISKKLSQMFLKFASMHFKYFKKGYERKNCPKYFEIRKYTFHGQKFLEVGFLFGVNVYVFIPMMIFMVKNGVFYLVLTCVHLFL